jgi:hypothetical protein
MALLVGVIAGAVAVWHRIELDRRESKQPTIWAHLQRESKGATIVGSGTAGGRNVDFKAEGELGIFLLILLADSLVLIFISGFAAKSEDLPIIGDL